MGLVIEKDGWVQRPLQPRLVLDAQVFGIGRRDGVTTHGAS